MRLSCNPFLRVALAEIALLAAEGIPVVAQIDTGAVAGRVVDSTGATIPNAQVELANTQTNFVYRTRSNGAGEWAISPVHIGTYRVSVVAEGFRRSVGEPFTLSVQQRQQVDFTMQTGEVSSTVDVTGSAPVLETATSERSQLIDSETMRTLPLNGRNPVQLAQLTAGVTVSEPGARDEGGFGFSANGARSLQNNFLLDGIDNNSNLPDLLNEANYVIMPSVDALEEFRVATDSYSAEFGRATGAVVNATTKSGTNRLHGVFYEFLRNQAFDARNYFDPALQPYHQNQFGATLGGPILKDRLFFFVDYEGLRVSQSQTNTAVVPTAATRAGDFSSQLDLASPTGVRDCNGQMTYAGELFNTNLTQVSAASPTGFCGTPFGYNGTQPSNIIPAAEQDALGARLAQLFPLPNANGNGYNFVSNPKTIRTSNQGDARVDQVLTRKDNIFYRFGMSRQPSTIPGPFTGFADGGGFFTGVGDNRAYLLAVSETHVFSPTRVNEIRLGYNRLHTSRSQFNSGTDVSAQVGFPGVPFDPGTNNGGLPQIFFNDVATIGSPTYLPSNEIQNTYQLSDVFTLIAGSHSLKFGGEIRPEEFTIFQPAAPRGTLTFGPQYTDNAAALGAGGSGLASLLTGQTEGGSINNINNVDYNRRIYGAFLQDDWRATPKLTINVGVRYDFFSAILERHNNQANFNPVTGALDVPASSNVHLTPTLASTIPVNHTASKGLIPPVYTNISPRFGLAYQFAPRWVLRTAAGLFFNGEESGPYSNPSPGFNPPYFASQSFTADCSLPSYNAAAQDCSVADLRTLANGFPSTSLSDPNTPNLFSEDNLKTPYVEQWHLTVQHELGSRTTAEIAYVGSKGTHLYTTSNRNQAYPTADLNLSYAERRPFPYVDTAIGWLRSNGFSNYNSGQVKVEQHLSHGVAAIVNYTYSHGLGNSSSANLGAQNNDGFRDSLGIGEYGNLDFDVRHRFTAGYSWDLPIGRGKLVAGGVGPVLDHVIGHWQLSGVATLSSGTWYTVTAANSFANSDGQQRPDFAPGQKSSGRPCVPGTFFNTCAFQNPQPGSLGNVSLNTVNGPGNKNWDMSLLKNVPLHESVRLELRGEFYNAFNHPNFLFAAPGPQNGNNATVFGSGTFGFVTGARDPRLIQIGAKIYF